MSATLHSPASDAKKLGKEKRVQNQVIPVETGAAKDVAPAKKNGAGNDKPTPMMQQFFAIKQKHKDYLLFYRMGDFYELFFDDAHKAAAALDIALTKRGQHMGQDIPMCGVPVHSHETYLHQLIQKGFKVAICEQLEDPAEAKKRGHKAVVKRDVVRIITPGTLSEETLLEGGQSNFLAAVGLHREGLAIGWLDMSTGSFGLMPVSEDALASELARLQPKELLLDERLYHDRSLDALWQEWRDVLTLQPALAFDSERGQNMLRKVFAMAALDSLGLEQPAEYGVCCALLEYLELTQKGTLPKLERPVRQAASHFMVIDPATRRNLELHYGLSGDRKSGLLYVIDRTRTAAGARLLSQRLASPLTDIAQIRKRQESVAAFLAEQGLREQLRAQLKSYPDMERAVSRLCMQRGGPRDLAVVRNGLVVAQTVRLLLEERRGDFPEPVQQTAEALGNHASLIQLLQEALVEEPGFHARDGGFIAEGFAPDLDKQRNMRKEARQLVAALQARYQIDTGIGSLKIKHNNVLGYFIEITPTHQSKVPEYFIHRQSLASALRYTTTELAELQQQIAESADAALSMELVLFAELVQKVTGRAEALITTARALARIDVSTALAELADEQDYICPKVDDSLQFTITGGRHPVVERFLRQQQASFVANDCDLAEQQRLWLLTGPNMAGKSTFLRQNALIAILAQIGSYVPAESAHIGIVDQLFSRVGAADDLARGRSTFMVEMVETATILNQASKRALVILDEIGRGTATFDGLSIAWAVVEYLMRQNRCRGLFATHYHELTALAASLPGLSCHHLQVKEWKGKVVFLHSVSSGTADRSYGIHVAQLAGLPPAVIARARLVLQALEQGDHSRQLAIIAGDLPLFTATPHWNRTAEEREEEGSPEPEPEKISSLEAMLADIRPDELSPKEALQWIYALKEEAEQNS